MSENLSSLLFCEGDNIEITCSTEFKKMDSMQSWVLVVLDRVKNVWHLIKCNNGSGKK